MLFTISDGSQKDIVSGSQVLVVKGFLPPEFEKDFILIEDVDVDGPKARLEQGQISTISPELIRIVL